MPRSLPVPPMPTAAAAAAAAASPAGAWRVYRTPAPENTEYYFNTVTQQTQWVKPDELKTEEEVR